MPRYYFNYRTDDELIPDRDGRELESLEAAEQRAAELGKAIVDQAASTGGDARLPRSIELPTITAKNCSMSCSGPARNLAVAPALLWNL